MQKTTLRRIFAAAFAVTLGCLTSNVWADSEVTVDKAGTLSSLLPTSESTLKVNGIINGTDVKYLRQLINEGPVTKLDLSEVKIVKGGSSYNTVDGVAYSTTNDVIGDFMFNNCVNLISFVFPNSISTIGKRAFTNTRLRKVEIPDNVVKIGGDCFADNPSLITVVIGRRTTSFDQGVFYNSSNIKTVYVKPLTPPDTPAYFFTARPTIRVYTQVLKDYRESSWADYGTIYGKVEDTYPLPNDSSSVVNELQETFFEDAACTTLKAEYLAMSDEQLTKALTDAGMPTYMTPIAIKLKNDQWTKYEKEFRIHSYNAYSDANYWNEKLKSTGGSYMGNPTGIYTDSDDPIYVFVDSDVPDDATLYIAGCVGNDLIRKAKSGTKLQKGLNVVDGIKDALFYIVYTADTHTMKKTLSEWPDINIHIEGGKVNGYYDVSRHTLDDYLAILSGARHKLFTVKGGEALFNFNTSTYKEVWPKADDRIDRSICWYDSLTVWEKELMGICTNVSNGERTGAPFYLSGGESYFPIYYNNPNFAIEGVETDAGYANSTPYRTSYNSVGCVSASFKVTRSDHDDWCSAHESGHNNQSVINLEGCTEVSNNLFSNMIRFQDGVVTSVGSPLSVIMNDYALRIPYFTRSIDTMLRMYYQLYLYYHLAQKNTSFYPELFKALRNDPLTPYKDTNNSSLKFVRKVCEIVQEDLTDFFTAWGFFEPCDLDVNDYGIHHVTVTKKNIDATKAEISKYPKNRSILFIEDRAKYVLTTDFLTTAGKKRRNSEQVGKCGDLGQFTDYLPEEAQPSEYSYHQSDSIIAMTGTGGVGFLVLDSQDNMLYASNSYCFDIPSSVGSDYTIYSVDADGTLHEAEYKGSGTEKVYLTKAGTLHDSLSTSAIKAIIGGRINSTDIYNMRKYIENNFLSSIDLTDAEVRYGGMSYYQTYRITTNNYFGSYAFYDCSKLISIYLPSSITKIESNAFARSGLKEIIIPNKVTSIGEDAFAYCQQLNRVVIGPKVTSIAKGAFYSSNVKEVFALPLKPPTISTYLFSSNPIIHVYKSALAAYKASGWAEFGTLVGDLDDYEDVVSVDMVRSTTPLDADDTAVYDMLGRRVSHLQPGAIYIRNGRKVMTRP